MPALRCFLIWRLIWLRCLRSDFLALYAILICVKAWEMALFDVAAILKPCEKFSGKVYTPSGFGQSLLCIHLLFCGKIKPQDYNSG